MPFALGCLNKDIELLYSDESILVANKPAGLLTVPGKGPEKQDCLINRVLHNYPNARIVHRLDMATSGLVVIAQSHATQRHLSEQFASRCVQKTYLAKASGRFTQANGSIDFPLICDWPNRPKQKVDYEQGKPSLTHYEVIGYCHKTNTSDLVLTPITGRSHQLRVHLQALGHPIIGDEFYAPTDVRQACERLLLHAYRIAFKHPLSEEQMQFTLPCEYLKTPTEKIPLRTR